MDLEGPGYKKTFHTYIFAFEISQVSPVGQELP